TNGPLLVRSDNGRLLTERDVAPSGSARRYVAWGETTGTPVVYDPALLRYQREGGEPALFGEYTIGAREAGVACRTAFDLAAEVCRRYSPDAVQEICGVPADDVEHAARMLWESRPVAYYAWSGVEQQSNATQVARAISLLYTLTGSFDVEGGNVQFPAVPSPNVAGEELISPQQRTRALGLPDRPLGPGRWENVTTGEVYRAIVEQQPYPVRGLVGFGANLLLSHADARRGGAARLLPIPRSCSISPPVSVSAPISGTVTSTPPTATSSAPRACRSKRSETIRRACACLSRHATENMPIAPRACRRDLRRRPGR